MAIACHWSTLHIKILYVELLFMCFWGKVLNHVEIVCSSISEFSRKPKIDSLLVNQPFARINEVNRF